MKRLFTFALLALAFVGTVQAERTLPRKDYVTRIESCEAIIREKAAQLSVRPPLSSGAAQPAFE